MLKFSVRSLLGILFSFFFFFGIWTPPPPPPEKIFWIGACSLICVRPVQKPHCWVSHKTAHLFIITSSEAWNFDQTLTAHQCIKALLNVPFQSKASKCKTFMANKNLSMQYTENFSAVKIEISLEKKYDNFLVFAHNINCGYRLELPCCCGSNKYMYPQSMF